LVGQLNTIKNRDNLPH